MKIEIEIGETTSAERTVSVCIAQEELNGITLQIASAENLNRSDVYLRRHPHSLKSNKSNYVIDPNLPIRTNADKYKISRYYLSLVY